MVKMTCFRFNLDNPEHAKAWNYLHDFDKDKVKSGNTAVIKAVNEYFDRMKSWRTIRILRTGSVRNALSTRSYQRSAKCSQPRCRSSLQA